MKSVTGRMAHNPGTDGFALSVLQDDLFAALYRVKVRPSRDMARIRKRQAVMNLPLDFFPDAEDTDFDQQVQLFSKRVGALDGFLPLFPVFEDMISEGVCAVGMFNLSLTFIDTEQPPAVLEEVRTPFPLCV
jgi:hypothetical protein